MSRPMHRREVLRGGAALAGGLAAACAWPEWLAASQAAQQPQPPADQIAAMRAQMSAIPIETAKLTDRLTMLSGPGGNVVVLSGPDGKFVVDTFIQGAWPKLKLALDALGTAPVKAAIDTHWHWDHADNNSEFKKSGAAVIAHENTAKRLGQSHQMMGATFPASPPEAQPTQTFTDTHVLDANGEQVRLRYVQPAHTDTDIYILFSKANVVHLGDLYFNGIYPFIDASTGGNMAGMIAAADASLKMATDSTKIVPGHGPLADKKALTAYRDMLVTVRDRVQKLKTEGRNADEAVAAKPTKDLDDTWGKGFMQPDNFVRIVYGTL